MSIYKGSWKDIGQTYSVDFEGKRRGEQEYVWMSKWTLFSFSSPCL